MGAWRLRGGCVVAAVLVFIAGAVLTGLTTHVEEQAIFDKLLANPVHVCSFSPFNTYFIL